MLRRPLTSTVQRRSITPISALPTVRQSGLFLRAGSVIIRTGDALSVLKTLPDRSHQTCITSPPYYGLRDYGTGEWIGGDPKCDHLRPAQPQRDHAPDGSFGTTRGTEDWRAGASKVQYTGTCRKCGARRTDLQLGLEQTPEEYITKLVEIFREVRRVLRDDGTCWIVIDDSYASAPGNSNFAKSTIGNTYNYHMMRKHGVTDKTKLPNTKHKDMIGIPWMLAVALRADGWWLRSDIIWQKPVHMPESVTDRPTSSYEHVFLLAKSKDYFWDDDAIAEPDKTVNASRGPDPTWDYGSMSGGNEGLRRLDQRYHYTEERPMRNVRDVWTIPVEPFMFKLPGDDLSHFATFPKQLVERCVKAGTSEMGCCPTCGAPYDRVTSKGELDTNNVALMTVISRSGGNDYAEYHGHSQKGHINAGVQDSSELKSSILRGMRPKKHEWAQTCKCLPQPAVPCWVLDPFGGTGTTGLVAAMQCTPNGQPRHATLIELNPKYVRLARQRIITESMGNVDVIIEEQA